MFCPNCGTENQENAQFCSKCGGQMATAPAQTAPPAASVLLSPGEVPPEIKGFNFGAFALNFIWAFAHNLIGWGIIILVIGLIPVVQIINIGFAIYLGVKGNELAWKKRRFESVQQFKETQRVWNIAGIIVFCTFIPVSIAITGILAAVAIPNFIRARETSLFASCRESLSGVRTAEEMYMSDHGVYTDVPDRLATYMIPGCTNPNGDDCKGFVPQRIGMRCKPGSLKINVPEGGMDYQITGTAKTQTECNICVSSKGISPENFRDCLGNPAPSCPE